MGILYSTLFPTTPDTITYNVKKWSPSPKKIYTEREIKIIHCNGEIVLMCSMGQFADVCAVASPDEGVNMLNHEELDKEGLWMCAIDRGATKVIQFFLEHHPEFVSDMDFRGMYNMCIKKACARDDIVLVDLLMDPNVGKLSPDLLIESYTPRGSNTVFSALADAAMRNNGHTIEFLATKGYIRPYIAQAALDELHQYYEKYPGGLCVARPCIRFLEELANPRVKGAMS